MEIWLRHHIMNYNRYRLQPLFISINYTTMEQQ